MTDRTKWKAPCVLCGYNGPGFFQPSMHPCATRETERDSLIAEVERLRAEAKRADEEATKLANSDLATTEQVIRALRVENDALTDDLLTACKDALHTLENTTTGEPDWARGTVALLREAIARAERER